MGTPLLDDDGSASIATLILSVHHALRRDVALLARALESTTEFDGHAAALAREWAVFAETLHEHHTAEDGGLFPGAVAQRPQLAPIVEQLEREHRQLEPLIARGTSAFASLSGPTRDAAAAMRALSDLLSTHLALEEEHVVPVFRGAKQFPPLGSDAELAKATDGFAWACRGLAEPVLAAIFALLPPDLAARLPAAQATHRERCAQAFGADGTGASTTSTPDWLSEG